MSDSIKDCLILPTAGAGITFIGVWARSESPMLGLVFAAAAFFIIGFFFLLQGMEKKIEELYILKEKLKRCEDHFKNMQ